MQGDEYKTLRERTGEALGVLLHTQSCVVPAGVQRLECILPCGCCSCDQSENAEAQAGVCTSKAIGKVCAFRKKSRLCLFWSARNMFCKLGNF